MTLLEDALEQKKFDTRMIERNLRKNEINQSQVDAVLSALPDDADFGEMRTFEDVEKA